MCSFKGNISFSVCLTSRKELGNEAISLRTNESILYIQDPIFRIALSAKRTCSRVPAQALLVSHVYVSQQGINENKHI